MIVSVAHTKGGVGKSLQACNLAITRANKGERPVLLVDADVGQGSSLAILQLRAEQMGLRDVATVALSGHEVRTYILQNAARFVDVVVDCGGRDTSSLRAALAVSDKLICPVPPRTLEIWATQQVGLLVEEAQKINPKLRAYTFLNMADPAGTENAEAAAALREYEPTLSYMTTTVGRRKVFADAISQGKSIFEYSPRNPKAIEELRALIVEIYMKVG